jgi:hypothetical protein
MPPIRNPHAISPRLTCIESWLDADLGEHQVIYLFVLIIRLMVALCLFSLWLCWALIAVPALIICQARGNQSVARSWERSLRWHRHLHLF